MEDITGLTGYGIAPYEVDNEYPLITVDCKLSTVNGVSFEEFVKEEKPEAWGGDAVV